MKKLLLIGNKPLDKDYSSIINTYDKVARVNRMLNYNMCSGKTDLWLVDVFKGSESLYDAEIADKFKNAKEGIVFESSRVNCLPYLQKIGFKGQITTIPFDDNSIRNFIPAYHWDMGRRVTNTIRLLIYCLTHFSKEYEIHTLGIGNRYFLNTPTHIHHCRIFKSEEYFLEKLITEKKIFPLDFDLDFKPFVQKDKTEYTKKIPSFSSFWHSGISTLPRFVVASINSFVKNGCPYYLYTYKKYDNIPDGCIVRDANEIIPFSEFFLGKKNDYASFADYFRVRLICKEDTAWTDTDNFFVNDTFETDNVLIVQDGRVQNSFVYLGRNEEGNRFKQMLAEFYDDPQKIREYDNEEMVRKKVMIMEYPDKISALSNAEWGIGGSTLYTNIAQTMNIDKTSLYDYYEYFNDFKYDEQFALWTYDEQEYMHFRNQNVKILVLSMNLLARDRNILINFNPNSYVGKLLKRYS